MFLYINPQYNLKYIHSLIHVFYVNYIFVIVVDFACNIFFM